MHEVLFVLLALFQIQVKIFLSRLATMIEK